MFGADSHWQDTKHVITATITVWSSMCLIDIAFHGHPRISASNVLIAGVLGRNDRIKSAVSMLYLRAGLRYCTFHIAEPFLYRLQSDVVYHVFKHVVLVRAAFLPIYHFCGRGSDYEATEKGVWCGTF